MTLSQSGSLLKQLKPILIAIAVSLFFYYIAGFSFSDQQARLIGVIALLVSLWTNKGLPLGVVSLLPILLFPLLDVLDANIVTSNYSKTTIFLFIGGFLLAIATRKTNLHQRVADKLLKLFPSTPRGVLYSVMLTAGCLSSILSSTTTALLIIPIADFLTDDKRFKFRLLLGTAYASVIGGIITPIGTPPNLILLDFLQSNALEPILFMHWVAMMLPLAIMMMLLAAEILLFGLSEEPIQFVSLGNSTKPLTPKQKKLVFILVGLAFILVMNPVLKSLIGFTINEKLTLLGFGLLLFLPGINLLNWDEDFSKIPFAILFLFGAGFSFASAFSHTGLAQEISSLMTGFEALPVALIMISISAIVVFSTEITSNTALSSIMIPIVYAFTQATGLSSDIFLMLVAISASYAFMLPVATPPNAIAMSTGHVETSQMMQRGFFLNILGIVLTYLMAAYYWTWLIGDL